MPILGFDALADGDEFDFVIVGSGFGGSVSAFRLAQKGYSVAVIEAGRHFKDDDFARTNWDTPRYLWLPRLFCFGIQRLTLLKDFLLIHGAGVGGGSLVYGNTLLEPKEGFYQSSQCQRLDRNLRQRLAPHFETAKKMLGVAVTPRMDQADHVLRQVAQEMNREHTFEPTQVGVFFGEPDKKVPDPYFGGEGPERSGCNFCGGCMVGCRYNAKNTLMKNYLYFALKLGVKIFSLSTINAIEEIGSQNEGFQLSVSRSGWGWQHKKIRARKLILSAGVIGTMKLLMSPQNRLMRLSSRLGRDVRTNAEVLVGSTALDDRHDWSQGVAISSRFWPDQQTHVEVVRYSKGSDAMNFLAFRKDFSLKKGLTAFLKQALSVLGRPIELSRTLWPLGWAKRSTILLVMQDTDSRLRLLWREILGIWPLLTTRVEDGDSPPPRHIKVADETLDRFSKNSNGVAQVSVATEIFGVVTTAHILGGAVMGTDPQNGVTDIEGKVFGYQNLWVIDGSLIPANLGVNPSLTITALAEHAMAAIGPKSLN